jgi:tRNA(Arg) A34 adenosine deaminase TadA
MHRLGMSHRLTASLARMATGVIWSDLDEGWQVAFEEAWDAFRTGNIAVGAVACDARGNVVYRARNRVADREAPAGQVFGASLAHAETNVLAQVPFRSIDGLVLTTTLQPCLQCSAAIRQCRSIEAVRIAGSDRLWDGCDDLASISPWIARRGVITSEGPRRDGIGVFGTLISRFGLGLIPVVERRCAKTARVHGLESSGWCERAVNETVTWAIRDLWSELQSFTS